MDRIEKISDAQFNLTCIFCGRTDAIQAWPHRNPAGQMVGMIFACALCQEKTKNLGLQIVSVQPSAPAPEKCPECGGTIADEVGPYSKRKVCVVCRKPSQPKEWKGESHA